MFLFTLLQIDPSFNTNHSAFPEVFTAYVSLLDDSKLGLHLKVSDEKDFFFLDNILRYFPILYFCIFVMFYIFYCGKLQTYSKAESNPYVPVIQPQQPSVYGHLSSTMQSLPPLKKTLASCYLICAYFCTSLKDKYNHSELIILRKINIYLCICMFQIGFFENCCISK